MCNKPPKPNDRMSLRWSGDKHWTAWKNLLGEHTTVIAPCRIARIQNRCGKEKNISITITWLSSRMSRMSREEEWSSTRWGRGEGWRDSWMAFAGNFSTSQWVLLKLGQSWSCGATKIPLHIASSLCRSDLVYSAPLFFFRAGPFGWAPARSEVNLGAGAVANRPWLSPGVELDFSHNIYMEKHTNKKIYTLLIKGLSIQLMTDNTIPCQVLNVI